MIFIGGGGGFGLLALLAIFLLFFSGGDPGLLILVLFVGVPYLLFRMVRRAARTSVSLPPMQTPPQQQAWQPPQQPVLPPVTAADVSSLRDRLGHDVRSLEPGDDPVSRQAMADASERYSTASTLLERATSDAQLRTSWLAAVEGLNATRIVRQRQGLDVGPPVPALPSSGQVLTRPARIDMEGRSYTGAPAYEPGHPHWFPGGYYGGRHVPGGWYDVPFWPSALVLGGLGGWALGGLMAGAMYGDGLYGDEMYGGGVDHGGFEDAGADGGFGGFGGGGGWDGGG
ncbi:MAG: hypothetical protein JWM62_750, partial [Frankiales bacterium]|nr:hypothetical protein [Frankiales bacterium]